ncbi:MAG TPA: homoserine kinase, partial [Candidatus Norongarragalinales archaeon]|nr:homoserine kinase [Candidatus Norongarragalinales archaeon]
MPKRNALFPKITVRCPATSANLGPGFDIAGMALSSPSDLMVFEVLGERAITIANSGKYDVPSEADKNTLGPVIRKICADHLISDGFKITIEKNIKPASGLGSSAATAAGAAVALNAMYGLGLSKKELIAYASLGEEVAAGFPHADNVSPAIMGGIVLSSETTGRIEFAAFPTIDLDLLVILPGKDKGSTKIMREAIPDRVDWKDARANMQAVSLLFEAALDSSPEKFIQAVHRKDLIVEKARATVPALSHLPAIQALGDEYGFGVFASGSGPAVIAACLPSNKRKEEFARGALDLFAKQGIGVETNWAKISGKGVEIVGRDGKISEVRCIECGHPEQD